MRTLQSSLGRRVLFGAWVAALLVLAVSAKALAFGNIQLKTTTVDEVDKRWKFEATVDYGSKPHMGHIPFDFVFELKTYYENSITDQDPKPVIRRKPMHNQQPQREEMDIGFADARGEIWQKTKFSFALRRDRGFAAGEYTLKIQRSSDGATLGRPMTIILQGENELIDRRAMVFASPEKKPDKKAAAKEENKDGTGTDKADSEKTDSEKADTEKASSETESSGTEPETGTEGDDQPQTIKDKPGGCGCGVAEKTPWLPRWLSVVGLLGALLLRRSWPNPS